MDFINPPATSPQYVTHGTFYSQLVNHDVGYNIFLPPDYENGVRSYPVTYHLHGYKGNESSDLGALEKVYKNREAITVFANGTSSNNGYRDNELPMESMIINELIPYIDGKYRTDATRENRSISGFSMGGAGAFYYAVKYPELFGSVTAYAGTYHHFYHEGYRGVGEPPQKAVELYENMMKDTSSFYEDGILFLIRQNAERIRSRLDIKIHIGTADILFCDNEILHLYLNSLNIPHEYRTFEGSAHELDKVL